MKKHLASIALAASLAFSLASPAQAKNEPAADTPWLVAQLQNVLSTSTGRSASAVSPEGEVEIGFSPNAGALELVLKTIRSAHRTLDVMAYSFTSADVTRALLDARKRGVQVRVLVDHDHNLQGRNNAKPLAALSALANAGAQVRTVSAFAIHHDKIVLCDMLHVQTGSFNYSAAAATRNSENVIVLWNAPASAKVYGQHFENNWRLGQAFNGR